MKLTYAAVPQGASADAAHGWAIREEVLTLEPNLQKRARC